MKFVILLLIALVAWAADPTQPLPAEVIKIQAEHDAAVSKAKAAFDQAVAKADQEAVKKLEPVVTKFTKAGDLKSAVAAQSVLDGWTSNSSDLLANGGGKITVITARYGIEGRWVDATKFLRSKIKDGNLHLLVNDDVHSVLGDPAGGQVKSFVIVYSLGNSEKKTATFAKGEMIDLGTTPP